MATKNSPKSKPAPAKKAPAPAAKAKDLKAKKTVKGGNFVGSANGGIWRNQNHNETLVRDTRL